MLRPVLAALAVVLALCFAAGGVDPGPTIAPGQGAAKVSAASSAPTVSTASSGPAAAGEPEVATLRFDVPPFPLRQ